MFYVYEWYNVITGEIFYVGKGCNKRKGQISKRNEKFKEYYNQNQCDNRIIKEFENEQEAFDYEHERITELKAIGQASCNLDNGGTGGHHFIWTPEMRKYASKYNVMKRPEQRERMSEDNPMKDPTVASKVSEKQKKPLWVGETLYKGLIDASNDYNVTPQAFSYWLKRGYTNDYQVCYYDGDSKPELHILKPNIQPVLIDDIYYPSIAAAARAINGNASSLAKALREHRSFKGHTCKYGNQHPSQTNSD